MPAPWKPDHARAHYAGDLRNDPQILSGAVRELAERVWDCRAVKAAIPDAQDLSRELSKAVAADVERCPAYFPENDCRVKWLRQVIDTLQEQPRQWPETPVIDAGVAFVIGREMPNPTKVCGKDLASEPRVFRAERQRGPSD